METQNLLKFTKMHGCGNDYIYINCLENEIESPEALAVKLSDRHFGIGGDGIVLICRSSCASAKMRMFNLDGSEGKMCGNAIRCVAKYLYDEKITDRTSIDIETLSGIKHIDIKTDGVTAYEATVNMGNAVTDPKKIPVNSDKDIIVNEKIRIGSEEYGITCVSMGNPHCVVFCDDPKKIPLEKIGPLFEHNEIFPEGVNTEFVKVCSENELSMRVWERGSGETLACGTGACASAYAAILNGFCKENTDIKVNLTGGVLTIKCCENGIFMTGNAVRVFDGIIKL